MVNVITFLEQIYFVKTTLIEKKKIFEFAQNFKFFRVPFKKKLNEPQIFM